MKRYNLLNNVFGWISFFIAATVYLLTIEPTSSFWDVGEFITSSYKMEVGHPPGAPFFMLTAKFFSLFASDVTQVAKMMNSMSAIMSALTILFLFWTITHLARKLVHTEKNKEMSLGQMVVIIGSGLVGALTYTFSDTFWFSAVEAEVYAYSSMFTALVFWLILKWENRAEEKGSDKWLVLIAYAMGLSIGVHLLNLLCIPAIVLVYYFKKNETANVKGTALALLGSFALIVILMYGVIPGFTQVGGWFELLFVNTLGFAYNTGAIVYLFFIAATVLWGLYETFASKGNLKRAKIAFVLAMSLAGVVFIGSSWLLWLVLIAALLGLVFISNAINFRLMNTALLCLMVILVGYSSFALIPIRSIANPPMDQNSPEHVFTLASYLNREQYGDRPLFYGKTYASDYKEDSNGRTAPAIGEKTNYDKIVKVSDNQKDKYIVSTRIPIYEYSNTMLFPRMYSQTDRHLDGYAMWAGVDLAKDSYGNIRHKPTMFENIRFFMTYQLDYMYFRYFMWNFSGRQNDIQGDGGIAKGNWITGIGFLDELMGKGPQDNLPPDIADNKGHNTYYALPFLLGILGVFFQVMSKKEGEKQFLITFLLFFMTGIAIIIYLNQQPFEPRERDYAYAGSFYAFSIWIGLGVGFLWRLTKKILPELPAATLVTVLTLIIPIQMAAQNWDDHDRSDRYTMRDYAINYLDTCEPNAILFTMGDNDTFPLWYLQEVEGYRTDVRVCNLSYLQTDWYVDQMRRDAYDSEGLPITWDKIAYTGDRGQASHVITREDLQNAVLSELSRQNDGKINQEWLRHLDYGQFFDTKAFSSEPMDLGEMMEIYKTRAEYVPKNPYVSSGIVMPNYRFTTSIDMESVDWTSLNTRPDSVFTIDIGKNKGGIYRQELMIMEMLYNVNKDNWKRPMYYAVTIGAPPLNLSRISVYEGINLRILPGKADSTGVNVDKMFDNMVNKYQWGGVENPNVYLDENNLRMARSFRFMFTELISALMQKGDTVRALQALDKCIATFPGNTVPRGSESLAYADAYFGLGEDAKGQTILDEIYSRADRSLNWYSRLDRNEMIYAGADIREFMGMKLQTLNVYGKYQKNESYKSLLDNILPELDNILANGVMFRQDRIQEHPLLYLLASLSYYNRGHNVNEVDEQYLLAKQSQIYNMLRTYLPEVYKSLVEQNQ